MKLRGPDILLKFLFTPFLISAGLLYGPSIHADQGRDPAFEKEALAYIRRYAKPKRAALPKYEILFSRPAAKPGPAPAVNSSVPGSVLTPSTTSIPTNAPAFARPQVTPPANAAEPGGSNASGAEPSAESVDRNE